MCRTKNQPKKKPDRQMQMQQKWPEKRQAVRQTDRVRTESPERQTAVR